MPDIEVEIAGLPTPVDSDEWASDPEAVTRQVLKNREDMRKGESILQKAALSLFSPKQTVAAPFGIAMYGVTSYQGRRVNEKTRQILDAANKLLKHKGFGGETSDMTLVQGSYNGGRVSQSAGTHDGGGAGDLTAFNYKNRVRVLRLLGCAAWYRPTLRNVWSAHIHFIVIGDSTASRGAKNQVSAYKAGRNGLANNGPDPDWRPVKVNIDFVTNASLGVYYTNKKAGLYAQPYGASHKYKTLAKGKKFTVIAKVTNAYGNTWGVNPNGRWVDMRHLTKSKPEPVVPATKERAFKVSSQNFSQDNSYMKARWKQNRAKLVNGIVKKNPHVLFSQELPRSPRNYVDAKLSKERSKLKRVAGNFGRYIYIRGFKKVSSGTFAPKARVNGQKKYVSWTVQKRDGRLYLFVNAHGQSGSNAHTVKVRKQWTNQTINRALKIAANNNVPVRNIIFGGDWNGTTGITNRMKKKGFVPTFKVANRKAGEEFKTHRSPTGDYAKGLPIDMIFVHESRTVSTYHNKRHKFSDHSLITSVVKP